MSIVQESLTLLMDIKQGKESTLGKVLDKINQNPASNPLIPFGKFETVHFARFIILPETRDLKNGLIPASLIFASNVDGNPIEHLKELINHAGPGLDQIFQYCKGYPETQPITLKQRLRYFKKHMIDSATYYVNTQGRTVKQIHLESKLRETIETFLDQKDWSRCSALEVRQAICDFVHSHPEFKDLKPAKAFNPPWWEVIRKHSDQLDIAGIIDQARSHLSFLSNNDKQSSIRPANAQVRKLTAYEDIIDQNQFSAIGFPKEGGFLNIQGMISQIPLKLILPLANLITHTVFNKGNLANVKTIHFARWVPLNYKWRFPFIKHPQRVLFCSNYDGSQENYMGAFIDLVAWGLNLTFSREIRYPDTRFLIFDGAKNEQAFKRFIRTVQIPTQAWYSAYPHLSAANLNNNSAIRHGLFGKMSEQAAQDWLHRF